MELVGRLNTLFPQASIETDIVISPERDEIVSACRVSTPRGAFTAWAGVGEFDTLSGAIARVQETAIQSALTMALTGVSAYQEEEETEPSEMLEGFVPLKEIPLVTLNEDGRRGLCTECGQTFGDFVTSTQARTLDEIIQAGMERFGRAVCIPCYRKLQAEEAKANPPAEEPKKRTRKRAE